MDSLEKFRELINGCISGSRHSQNHLYKMLAPNMYAVCLRYSKNREEAEEILQEGFIRVFGFMHQYKYKGSFEGWVRKIMVNCALQKYRSKKEMHVVSNLDNAIVEKYGSEDIISRISVKELLGMIQQLSPAYRTIFNLYVFEGMKHREIAKHLGISEGTSKSNLSDARLFLKKAVFKSMQIVDQKINEG